MTGPWSVGIAVDLLVEHALLVVSKIASAWDEGHRALCVNDLKASGLPLCLLPNFGKLRPDIKAGGEWPVVPP